MTAASTPVAVRARRNLRIWATEYTMANMCRVATVDAKLRYPDGNIHGQAGWDLAFRFKDLDDLAAQLEGGLVGLCDPPLQRGEIERLAIMAHGNQAGRVYVAGKANSNRALTPENVIQHHRVLHRIGLYTKEHLSTILFMGCLAGQGEAGSQLLKLVSQIWTGRLVVGFTTIGFRHAGMMSGEHATCEYPGMRDTDVTDEVFAASQMPRLERLWSDFARMPWAADTSIHAKSFRNGAIERCPPGDTCNIPPRPPKIAPTVRPPGR